MLQSLAAEASLLLDAGQPLSTPAHRLPEHHQGLHQPIRATVAESNPSIPATPDAPPPYPHHRLP